MPKIEFYELRPSVPIIRIFRDGRADRAQDLAQVGRARGLKNRSCKDPTSLMSNRSISVDTKKKELVGDFKNGGRELRLKGDRSRCGSMTSSFPSWDGSLPMGSTIWARTEAG